jgi:hypothetical protein
MSTLESKWQWVSNCYGPMGWFTDAQKAEADFKNGHWERLGKAEVVSMQRTIDALAYEQS